MTITTPATTAFAGGPAYGYYPRTMIQLCAASYLPIGQVADAVAQLGWTVTWGPAELVAEDESYSLAFIASRTAPGGTAETTLVLRGTNFDSVKTWLSEDFEVASTQPFATVVPGAPPAALIARGTGNGLRDLLRLTDRATGTTIVDFLTRAKPAALYVTGHSLGGTLAPPMFAVLKAALIAAGSDTAMGMWTFAGLTPGNEAFNSYLAGLIDFKYPWRLHNTLDVAPCCWGDLQGLKTVYGSADRFGLPEDLALDVFVKLAGSRGYAQPEGGLALPGTLQPEAGHFDWAKEAAFQHHPQTYQQLVNQVFPDSEE